MQIWSVWRGRGRVPGWGAGFRRVVPVPQLVSQAAGEATDSTVKRSSRPPILPQGYAAAEGYRHHHQVHEVDQVGREELAHRRGSSADADVTAVRGLLGQAEHLSGGPSTNRKLVPLGKSIVGCG